MPVEALAVWVLFLDYRGIQDRLEEGGTFYSCSEITRVVHQNSVVIIIIIAVVVVVNYCYCLGMVMVW